MSSGFFPLDRPNQFISSGASETLEKTIKDLRDLSSKYYDQICSDLNAEDACSDGQYLGYISLACELLERCLRPKVNNPSV